jgi:septum site-determining protein MinC
VEPAAASKAPTDSRTYPFQVRGSLQTLLALRLIAPEDPDFFTLLLDKIAHAPDFFRDAPIVLDVAPIAGVPPIDLQQFVARLREHRLSPVGIQNASAAWAEAASEAGLAIFAGGGRPTTEVGEQRRSAAPTRAASTGTPQPPKAPSLIVREPVRGGQQIHAPDGDLVVLAPVAHGAEVAAAGHIHVYGALRGRAFAGTGGDESAMIFCDQLDADLVSIAGIYLVNEDIDARHLGKRVRISCDGERLVLTGGA